MNSTDPMLRTGIALGATVGVAYTTCALFFWIWPEAAMALTNALFHGLDFRKLRASAAFSLGGFAYALVVMVVWAFILGVVFAWLRGPRNPAA